MAILIKFCLMFAQSSLPSTFTIFGFLIMMTSCQFFRPQQKSSLLASDSRSKVKPWFQEALPGDMMGQQNQNFHKYFKCAFSQWRSVSKDNDVKLATFQSFNQERSKNGQIQYRLNYRTIKGKSKNIVLTLDDLAQLLIFTPKNILLGSNFYAITYDWNDISFDPAIQHMNKLFVQRSKRTDLQPTRVTICHGLDTLHRRIFEVFDIEYVTQGKREKNYYYMGMDTSDMMTAQMIYSQPKSVPNFRNYPSYNQIVKRVQSFLPQVNRKTINGMLVHKGDLFGVLQFGLNGVVDIKLPTYFTSTFIMNYLPDDYKILNLNMPEAAAMDRIERRGSGAAILKDKRMALFGQKMTPPYSYMGVYETSEGKEDKTGSARSLLLKNQIDEEIQRYKQPARK